MLIECGILTKKENESKRLLLGGGSWTINIDKLGSDFYSVNKFRYVTHRGVYEIGRFEALQHGFFRNLGGEKKLVVPVKFWEFKKGGF
jgi:hypothetical protein